MLKDKTFIVTGASEGLGKAIALKLAESGANLVLIARRIEELTHVAQEAKKAGSPTVLPISCDLRVSKEIKSAIKQVSKEFDSIDGLINNAGIWQKLGRIQELSDEQISSILNTNLNGLILMTKYSLPLINKSGSIINISSRSGYSAQAGQAVYSASKYGVRGFTEVLREDLMEDGIRVAGVYQGGTNTKMFETAGEDWGNEKYKTFIPTEELAEVIKFMLTRPNQLWIPEVRIENK